MNRPEYVFVSEVKRGNVVYGRPGDPCEFIGNISHGSRVILMTPGSPEVTVPFGSVRPKEPEAVAA